MSVCSFIICNKSDKNSELHGCPSLFFGMNTTSPEYGNKRYQSVMIGINHSYLETVNVYIYIHFIPVKWDS